MRVENSRTHRKTLQVRLNRQAEMELWEQLALGALAILVLFMFRPGIKATIERSKNAEEKHWGTLIFLAVVLVAFVILLISSVR
jgi:hypothetical protein